MNTIGVGTGLNVRGVALEPVAEVTVARPRSVGDPKINIEAFYRNQTLWSGAVGLRIALGVPHRMYRYGALGKEAGHAAH